MTTFQTIICLAILAILVGAYMFYQAYKEKNTKIEFTPDNIKKTLTEVGALGISEPSEGGFMFRSPDGRVWLLDTADMPIVKLVTSWEPEIMIDWGKATSITDSLNGDLMGQYLVCDKEELKTITFICTSFMSSCNTLKENLPYMASYIKEALIEFIRRYNEIPNKTV